MTQTDQQNVPKLRFPEFGRDWKKHRLGELGLFKSGVGFSETEQGGTTGVPFYKVSDMNLPGNESVMTTANNYVTADQIARVKFKPIKKNAIIFAKVGAAIFLERKRRAKDFLLDNNMMAFIPGDGIGEEYLSHLFSVLRLSKFAQVGALPSYNGSDLATIKLSLPTLPEQRKIASFLGAVDTKIAQLSRKKALLEDYKKGCMQQLFSQKIHFKDDDGNDFPDWEEKRLGEVLTYEQPTKYLVASSEYSDAYKTPVLTAGKTFILGYTDETQGIFNRLPTIIFDDFTTAFKFVDFPFKAKSSAMKMLSLQNKDDDIRFVYAAMLQVDFQLGEHKRYWISEYQNEFIPVPHPDEQRKIADFLSAIDRKIELVGQQLEHAKTFKKGLLQQMFV